MAPRRQRAAPFDTISLGCCWNSCQSIKKSCIEKIAGTAADLIVSQQIFAVKYMHIHTKLLYQQGEALLYYADLPELFAKLLTY